MNLEQFKSPLPKPWLTISADAIHSRTMDATTITSGALEADTVDASGSVSTNLLFLDISGILPRPSDPLIACLNASDEFTAGGISRLKLNTSAGTDSIAYVSDIVGGIPTKILATDGESYMECKDGESVLGGFSTGGSYLESNKPLDYTTVYNPSGSCDMTCASDGIYLRTTTNIVIAGDASLKLQDYYMPSSAGNFGESLKTDGIGNASWGVAEEIRSADSLSFARCSNGLISLSQSGVGRLRLDPAISAMVSPSATVSFICSDSSAVVRYGGSDYLALTAGGLDFPLGATQRGLGIASTVFSCYSPVVSSGTAEASIMGLNIGTISLPANAFAVGTCWRVELGGSYAVSPPQTVRFRMFKSAGQLLLDTGALDMANSPGAFSLSCLITIQASGVAGVAISNSTTTARLDTTVSCVAFANSTTLNTTTTSTLTMTAQFGVANADTLTTRQIVFTRLI
jgi:hypothetical protein